MIPVTSQAQFLSFLSLSSKGTSWIAPLIIAALDSVWKGSALYVAIFAIVSEGMIGVIIIGLGVNHMRGTKFAEELEAKRRRSTADNSGTAMGSVAKWSREITDIGQEQIKKQKGEYEPAEEYQRSKEDN